MGPGASKCEDQEMKSELAAESWVGGKQGGQPDTGGWTVGEESKAHAGSAGRGALHKATNLCPEGPWGGLGLGLKLISLYSHRTQCPQL